MSDAPTLVFYHCWKQGFHRWITCITIIHGHKVILFVKNKLLHTYTKTFSIGQHWSLWLLPYQTAMLVLVKNPAIFTKTGMLKMNHLYHHHIWPQCHDLVKNTELNRYTKTFSIGNHLRLWVWWCLSSAWCPQHWHFTTAEDRDFEDESLVSPSHMATRSYFLWRINYYIHIQTLFYSHIKKFMDITLPDCHGLFQSKI